MQYIPLLHEVYILQCCERHPRLDATLRTHKLEFGVLTVSDLRSRSARWVPMTMALSQCR